MHAYIYVYICMSICMSMDLYRHIDTQTHIHTHIHTTALHGNYSVLRLKFKFLIMEFNPVHCCPCSHCHHHHHHHHLCCPLSCRFILLCPPCASSVTSPSLTPCTLTVPYHGSVFSFAILSHHQLLREALQTELFSSYFLRAQSISFK